MWRSEIVLAFNRKLDNAENFIVLDVSDEEFTENKIFHLSHMCNFNWEESELLSFLVVTGTLLKIK